jgi:cell division protein FtsQ
MVEKRKISVRKILQVALTAVVGTCCVIAMVSASKIEGDRQLKSLPVVHIKNDRKYQFIEQREIMDLAIYNRNVDILGTPVSRIDVHGIEQAIKADPWVADAQAFIDIDRVMHIYVTQRVPVVRLFKRDGTSCYMDSTLHTMPLSRNYTYYTMVVTNVPATGDDSAGMGVKKQIAKLVRSIEVDSFWSAQVSQIVIDSAGLFELVPVLGNQQILFGDTTGIDQKFDNLFLFYTKVLNRIGWDKYEVLDVRFNNQVVASPSLPYKGPVDMVIRKMNWITSIETTEALRMHEDSIRAAASLRAKIEAARQQEIARALERSRASRTDKGGRIRKKEKAAAHANAHKKELAKPHAKVAEPAKKTKAAVPPKKAPATSAAKSVPAPKETKAHAAAEKKHAKTDAKPTKKVTKQPAKAARKTAPQKVQPKAGKAKAGKTEKKDVEHKKAKYTYPEHKQH